MPEETFSEDIRARAARRTGSGWATARYFSPQCEEVGYAGEGEGHKLFGSLPDPRDFPFGDDGIDYIIWLMVCMRARWVIANMKTARYPKCLLVQSQDLVLVPNKWGILQLRPQPSAVRPNTLYILAGPKYLDGKQPYGCHGWEWGHQMMREPKDFWSDNDRLVHYKPRERLRPMEELEQMYLGIWRHRGLPAQRAFYPQPPDGVVRDT